MKLPSLLLITYLIASVYADGIPTCYERMWIWYAYQMASIVGDTTIVPRCAGRNCGFTQLMSEINNADYSGTPFLADESNKTPNVHDTAETLFNNGFDRRYFFRNVIGAATNYPDLLERLGERIFRVKAAASPAQLTQMKIFSDNADEALKMARGYRKLAFSDFMVKAMKQDFAITVKTAPGMVGEVFSLEETVRANPNMDAKALEAGLEDWMDNYPQPDPHIRLRLRRISSGH